MAINPNTNATMAGRITAADANYPYASAKDETSPGAGDGTPYFKARADDIFGFQQALLKSASIVPSGNADTAILSEYMQSLVEIASGRAINYDETGAADVYVFDVQSNQQGPQSLFDGLEANAYASNVNTGASTVNVNGLGVKSIKTPAGANPAAGDIAANAYIKLRFDLANDWWVLISLQAISGTAEVGATISWNTATPPTGYLEEDGASLLVASYPDLHAVIGYSFGGSGLNFNLDDKRGQFLRGWDHAAGVDPDAAGRTDRGDGTTGDNIGTKQVDDFKSHTHFSGVTAHNKTTGPGSDCFPNAADLVNLTGATGGNETRPVNTNVMFCIKY